MVSGTDGTFRVVLDAEDTDDLSPAVLFYDVWRMDTNEERVLALGPFEVLAVARLGDPT